MKSENYLFKRHFILRLIKPVGIFCVLLFLPLTSNSNEPETNVDTAFYFSILIDAKAENVWPFLFQLDKWKYSVEKLENITLAGDREGGVVAVYQDKSANQPGLMIKTLKILRHKHYSFTIYSYAGQFVGFAAYDLKEEKGKTQLTYDVYLRTTLAGVTEEQAAVRKQQIVEGMEMRQPKELAALKALVEL